jgi:prepilin-type N-terminal cleavage/methylation domain-containing protein
MKTKGFSLIEIMLGMTLFAVVMSAGMSVMYASLRASRKAAAVTTAKAEGAYAIQAMESMIRFATRIECPNSNTVKIWRVQNEGDEYQDIIEYSLNSDRIASTSASTDEDEVEKTIYLTSNSMDVGAASCPSAAAFVCSGDSVAICFEVNNVSGMDLTDVAGEGGGIKFQTRVTARNIFD